MRLWAKKLLHAVPWGKRVTNGAAASMHVMIFILVLDFAAGLRRPGLVVCLVITGDIWVAELMGYPDFLRVAESLIEIDRV